MSISVQSVGATMGQMTLKNPVGSLGHAASAMKDWNKKEAAQVHSPVVLAEHIANAGVMNGVGQGVNCLA
ncbi:MAG: hypothetical protein ACLFVY_02965 [Phycisphaerae bacterium]